MDLSPISSYEDDVTDTIMKAVMAGGDDLRSAILIIVSQVVEDLQ